MDRKIIKIYFENNEMEYLKTDNIDYVRFYSIRHGRKARREKYPTLQIFDIEEKKLAEMTINLNDYYLLKKYFANITIDEKHKYEWLRIPHFYRPYYVYKYATGISSAIYIARNILNNKEGYLEKYLEMLKTGGRIRKYRCT